MIVDGIELTNTNFFKVLDVANRDKAAIVDFVGRIKEERKFAEKVEKFLLGLLPVKFDGGEFEATENGWYVKRTLEGGRTTFDGDKILAEMGEDWVKSHQKRGEDFYKVVVKRVGEPEEPTKA